MHPDELEKIDVNEMVGIWSQSVSQYNDGAVGQFIMSFTDCVTEPLKHDYYSEQRVALQYISGIMDIKDPLY